MTDSKVLLELAERCEAATGTDAVLDADIALACQPLPYASQEGRPATKEIVQDSDGTRRILWTATDGQKHGYAAFNFDPLPVTASLDAAMTLVPEGCGFDLRKCVSGLGIVEMFPNGFTARWVDARAQTPALALCAAALKSRSSTTSDLGGGG